MLTLASPVVGTLGLAGTTLLAAFLQAPTQACRVLIPRKSCPWGCQPWHYEEFQPFSCLSWLTRSGPTHQPLLPLPPRPVPVTMLPCKATHPLPPCRKQLIHDYSSFISPPLTTQLRVGNLVLEPWPLAVSTEARVGVACDLQFMERLKAECLYLLRPLSFLFLEIALWFPLTREILFPISFI